MENWKNKLKSIGKVKERDKIVVRFKSKVDISNDIDEIEGTCQCMNPYYDKYAKEVVVIYNSDRVPNHLKEQGFYEVTKKIIVKYKDGKKDTLIFKGEVHEK